MSLFFKKTNLIFIVSLLLLSCGTQKFQTNEYTNDYQIVIDSIYNANPKSIGIIVHIESPDNGVSWSGCKGFADKQKSLPLQSNQPVLIASNIKTYVAATILRLQEENKLTIEDPIEAYLSEKTNNLFKNVGYDFNSIKIKHLLSHTSGIQNYANDDYIKFVDEHKKYRWTRDEQYQLSVKLGNPIAKPAEQFTYADVNYLLCTEIIENITKKPFYTSMRELLKYDSLNYNHTWFPTLEEMPKNTLPLVHQYWEKMGWDSNDIDISWDLYGGGGIATTNKELASFINDLFKHKIVEDPKTLELILTKIKLKSGEFSDYNLGIQKKEFNGYTAYGHGGFWGTEAMYFPDSNTSIAVTILNRDEKKLKEDIINQMIHLVNKNKVN